jgi:hypothetical protein
LFSKGDQLKVKLANLKFSETGDGRLFLVFGGRLVLGGRDYIYIYLHTQFVFKGFGWSINPKWFSNQSFPLGQTCAESG